MWDCQFSLRVLTELGDFPKYSETCLTNLTQLNAGVYNVDVDSLQSFHQIDSYVRHLEELKKQSNSLPEQEGILETHVDHLMRRATYLQRFVKSFHLSNFSQCFRSLKDILLLLHPFHFSLKRKFKEFGFKGLSKRMFLILGFSKSQFDVEVMQNFLAMIKQIENNYTSNGLLLKQEMKNWLQKFMKEYFQMPNEETKSEDLIQVSVIVEHGLRALLLQENDIPTTSSFLNQNHNYNDMNRFTISKSNSFEKKLDNNGENTFIRSEAPLQMFVSRSMSSSSSSSSSLLTQNQHSNQRNMNSDAFSTAQIPFISVGRIL
jgi:hypothetical protein